MNRLLAVIGDRLNPIVVKETRQAVNSRLVAGFLLLFLAIELIVTVLMISSRDLGGSDAMDLRAGRDIFAIVQGILLGTCMILIPTMTGMRLATERSDVNVDLLFISSLSPRAVLSGKLIAAAALALVVFSAAAPFMTFAYVMRGLDVPTILIVLLADYLAVLVATSFLLMVASIPAPRGLRIILGLAGFVGVCFLGGGLLSMSSEFLRFGAGFDTSSTDFWLAMLGLAISTFGSIGLFMFWGVALVSPPASNRAFGVRIYTVAIWLLNFIICAIWSWRLNGPEPVYAWGIVGTIWFSFMMLVAICERDEWGPRVAKKIPRNPLLWPLAFLTYSGAACGLLYAVLGCLLSIVGMAFWYDVVPPAAGLRREFRWTPVHVAAVIAGYTYCYGLTAVLFRRLLHGTTFRSGYTWLLAGILFGIGCTVPFILRFMFFGSQVGYHDETIWLYLPNPIVMADDAIDRRHSSHIELTLAFLGLWGLAVTVANGPWLIRQVVKFRYRSSDDDE